jgi:tRNA dimethylallyltransferase
MQAIQARGKVPLLVGGTMLYFHALMRGLDPMPPASPAIRKRIDAEAAIDGWPSMHARLAQVDAITAARLAPQDSQRIQRALEVWESSGQPLSVWHSKSAGTNADEAANAACLITLEPSSRAWLHQRIETRLDAMMAQGFADEVRALRARGDLSVAMPSMRCVGYRQAWEAMDADKPEGWRDAAVAASRQLAKRQLTWLRSMKGRHIVACDDEPERVLDAVLHVARELTLQQGSADQPITG